MQKITNHKITVIIAAVLIIIAIVAAAITPAALRRSEINNLFEIAQQYLNDLDYENAILAFTKILKIDPNNARAREMLQTLYLTFIRAEWDSGNIEFAQQLMKNMRDTLDLTEDPYTVTVTKKPTCDTAGTETWTCNLNDDVLKRDIPATDEHTWDDGVIITNATFSEEGSMTFVCTTCQSEKPEIIPVLVDEVFVVNDTNLEAALREAINKPTGTLMLSDFSEITNLDMAECEIRDISALAKLKQLRHLNLEANPITDLSPLAALTNLYSLDLSNTGLSDITPLANLTGLRYLYINQNSISDLSPLANLSSLEELWAWGNNISDLKPLENLTNLKWLQASTNQITDISPLANLIGLTDLTIGGNNISDLSPLSNLSNLTDLYIGDNNISDISPLAKLTNLRHLGIWDNNITDWSPVNHVESVQGRP